jgi:hypothetical protein
VSPKVKLGEELRGARHDKAPSGWWRSAKGFGQLPPMPDAHGAVAWL